MQQLAAAPATHPPRAFHSAQMGAAVSFLVPGQGIGVFRGERARGGISRPALILGAIAASVCLPSCSQLAEAYRFYDAHLERTVGVGQDAQRGDYAVVRWSPRLGDGKAVRP